MVYGVTFPEYIPNCSNGSPRADSNLGHFITRRFSVHYIRKISRYFPSSEFWLPKERHRYSSRLRAISTQPEFSRTLSVSFPIGTPCVLLNRCNPTTGPKTVSRSITGRALCPVRSAKSPQTPLVTAQAEARDRTD